MKRKIIYFFGALCLAFCACQKHDVKTDDDLDGYVTPVAESNTDGIRLSATPKTFVTDSSHVSVGIDSFTVKPADWRVLVGHPHEWQVRVYFSWQSYDGFLLYLKGFADTNPYPVLSPLPYTTHPDAAQTYTLQFDVHQEPHLEFIDLWYMPIKGNDKPVKEKDRPKTDLNFKLFAYRGTDTLFPNSATIRSVPFAALQQHWNLR